MEGLRFRAGSSCENRHQSFAVTSAVEGEALSAATTTARRGSAPRGGRLAVRGLRLWRRVRPLLAGAARIQEIARAATDLDAAAAVFFLALGADQRADAIALAAHRVQRVEACDLDVEF